MARLSQPNDIVVDALGRFYLKIENSTEPSMVRLGKSFELIEWIPVTEPVRFFRSAFKKELEDITEARKAAKCQP